MSCVISDSKTKLCSALLRVTISLAYKSLQTATLNFKEVAKCVDKFNFHKMQTSHRTNTTQSPTH